MDKWRVEQIAEWTLGQLRVLLEKYPPTGLEGLLEQRSLWEGILTDIRLVLDLLADVSRPTPVTLSKATPKELENVAQSMLRSIIRWDWLFIALGWGVAAVTAMWALYADKSFGTGWDYLAAFLWGSGVDQGLKGLSNVLTKLKVPQPGT